MRDLALEQVGDLEVGRADAVHDLDGRAVRVERAARGEHDRGRGRRAQQQRPARARPIAAAATNRAAGARLRDARRSALRARSPRRARCDRAQGRRPARASKLISAGTGRSSLRRAGPEPALERPAHFGFRHRLAPMSRRARIAPLRSDALPVAAAARHLDRVARLDRLARATPAVLASARPAAAMIMIEKLMIAMTHGVGPRSRPPPSNRRSAGEAKSQPSISRRSAARAADCAARRSGRPSRRSRAGSAARPGVALIRPTSWVATTTVVPSRLSAVNRCSSRLRHFGVDIAGRLVGDEQLGPVDHRAGDRDALLLSARQRRRAGARAVGEPDPGEHFAHRAFDLVLAARRRCAAAARHCRRRTRWRTRRKSWNTTPIRRRNGGRASRGASVSSSPNRRIRPRVGRCAR